MQIFTSYFAKINRIPINIIPISISLKPPAGAKCLELKTLAPTWNILSEYKNNGGNQALYTQRFKAEVLDKLDKQAVLDELAKLSGGADVALLCFERAGSFCHRNIVCEWLTGQTNELAV